MHEKKVEKNFQYGTAGFRTKANILDHVMYRMGILAVLRSKATKAAIGVMITASHNPQEDNGVKLIDPRGQMLHQDWESLATKVANASNEKLNEVIDSIISDLKINMNQSSFVLVARDTRPSSKSLSVAVIDGIKEMKSDYRDYNLLTTPQLHFMVKCTNDKAYGKPEEDDYVNKLTDAFINIHKHSNSSSSSSDLFVDAANGIGHLKLSIIKNKLLPLLNIHIFNDASTEGDILNHMCGADYVKVQQKPPANCKCEILKKYCSFDGDADRIVYYYLDQDKKFHLLDGDKIAVLFAEFIKDLTLKTKTFFKIGLIQTAYANGASTKFIKQNIKLPVFCVPTGVKHLHDKALSLDIGIYFEANGHGTVLYKPIVEDSLKKLISDCTSEEIKKSSELFLSFINLTNQTVGDAISDMLLVETILNIKNINIQQWDLMYQDLPCRQLKVKIKNRNIIKTKNAETEVEEPKNFQENLILILQKYKNARSFVRPSGTEDVVRVYAEADTQDNADNLALEVCSLVYEKLNGVGEKPTL